MHTYSNSSVHHHGTDSEHQERDGKSNTGIFCMRKRQKEYTEWIQLKILLHFTTALALLLNILPVVFEAAAFSVKWTVSRDSLFSAHSILKASSGEH